MLWLPEDIWKLSGACDCSIVILKSDVLLIIFAFYSYNWTSFNVCFVLCKLCCWRRVQKKTQQWLMGGTQTSQEYQSHVNVAEEEQKGSSLESIVKLPIDCFFGEPLAELLVPSNSGTQGNVVFLLCRSSYLSPFLKMKRMVEQQCHFNKPNLILLKGYGH